MFENIREDLRASYSRRVSLWRLPLRCLTTRGFRVVVLYRLARWCHLKGVPLLPRLLTLVSEECFTTAIHFTADIGPGLVIPHALNVIIGKNTKMGRGCWVYQGAGLGPAADFKSPTVGDKVYIFPGAQVIGGITIGDRVTIGANATVFMDIEAGSTVSVGRQIILKSPSPSPPTMPASVPTEKTTDG